MEGVHLTVLDNWHHSSLPAVETIQGGGWDVHAVEADEGEEVVSEFLYFVGVYLFAIGGEVVEEGLGESRGHVTA